MTQPNTTVARGVPEPSFPTPGSGHDLTRSQRRAQPEVRSLSRGPTEQSRDRCGAWRSLESLACQQLLCLPVGAPPAPAMLSALARPASAALRRSFSTSAQVGLTRGGLQAEHTPPPGPGHVCPRFASSSDPLQASLDRRAARHWLEIVAPGAGPDTGLEMRGRKPRRRGRGSPAPGPVHLFGRAPPRSPRFLRGPARLQG